MSVHTHYAYATSNGKWEVGNGKWKLNIGHPKLQLGKCVNMFVVAIKKGSQTGPNTHTVASSCLSFSPTLPAPLPYAHALGACGTSLRQFVSVKDAGLRAQSGVMLKNLITFTCANCLSARQGKQAGKGGRGGWWAIQTAWTAKTAAKGI